MDIVAIVGAAIISAAISVLMKQYKPEYSVFISLVAGIIIFVLILNSILPVLNRIRTFFLNANLSNEYTVILFKALGVCFITQIACDTCKDAGESAIASKVEIAGKLAVLLISLPLFEAVLSLVSNLML